MTTEQVARARRIIQKPWYARMRERKMRRMRKKCDMDIGKTSGDLMECVGSYWRYSRKEDWYHKKRR